jgi:hypothetical protein
MSDADTLAQFWSENLSLNEIGARPVAIRPDGQRACAICGAPAYFGFGVSIREGREGRWACREHREAVDRMSQAERESQWSSSLKPPSRTRRHQRFRHRRRHPRRHGPPEDLDNVNSYQAV